MSSFGGGHLNHDAVCSVTHVTKSGTTTLIQSYHTFRANSSARFGAIRHCQDLAIRQLPRTASTDADPGSYGDVRHARRARDTGERVVAAARGQGNSSSKRRGHGGREHADQRPPVERPLTQPRRSGAAPRRSRSRRTGEAPAQRCHAGAGLPSPLRTLIHPSLDDPVRGLPRSIARRGRGREGAAGPPSGGVCADTHAAYHCRRGTSLRAMNLFAGTRDVPQ
jgi:hypothetical protein